MVWVWGEWGLQPPPLGLFLPCVKRIDEVLFMFFILFSKCVENEVFFLVLFQFLLSKLNICLRFNHTIVCLIHYFLMDLNSDRHIRYHKIHHSVLWNANHYWCSKQWSRMLTLILNLASQWSYLCPTLNITWLHIHIWSLSYGLKVRCYLYCDIMGRVLRSLKSCPVSTLATGTEQEL